MTVALRGSADDTLPVSPQGPKILTIDIETSPNLAYVWGLFNENIPLQRLVESSEMLCFAAKWEHERKIMFFSRAQHGTETMIKEAYRLIDEADVLVHYYGKRFDYPYLCREFLLAGMSPPSPTQQIDLLTDVIRKKFKFTSNKLDHIAKELGVGEKIHKAVDFELWVGCMRGDPAAWATMERYNKQDVRITEQVFYKVKPWLGGLMNVGLYTGGVGCVVCGSANIQRRGFKYKSKTVVQQYACMDCGAWSTDNKALAKTELVGIS
jgi:hypothetical protein